MTDYASAEYDKNKVFIDKVDQEVIVVAEGPPGSAFNVGIQGRQGIQGVLGIQGPAGTFSAQGIQGPQGSSGAQGIQGVPGSASNFGAQGIQGLQGRTGAQGLFGPQGTQGVQGSAGIQGTSGIQGSRGTQGTQGTQGSTGATGSVGIGIQGPTGERGIQGVQGGLGTQGTVGIQGNTGIQGVQGPQAGNDGQYAVFIDQLTQTNPVGSVEREMLLRTRVEGSGPTLDPDIYVASNSRITFKKPGVYNLEFSAQFDRPSSGSDIVYIWLKKNGSAVSNSNTSLAIVDNPGRHVAAWNWVFTAAANDYYEIVWSCSNTSVRILAETSLTGPSRPDVPSLIVTVTEVVHTQIGAQGIQGLQGVQGTQGTQGLQGRQGVQGLQGISGSFAAQGVAGIQGIQGLQGRTGLQGTTGSGIQGTRGTQGLQGPAGVSGGGGGAEFGGGSIQSNTAVGAPGQNPLLSNTTGEDNLAIGKNTLLNNTTGGSNTAVGSNSLVNNTTGSYNEAFGGYSLYYNSTGVDNVAVSDSALYSVTDGYNNIAIGYSAVSTTSTTAGSLTVISGGSGFTDGAYTIPMAILNSSKLSRENLQLYADVVVSGGTVISAEVAGSNYNEYNWPLISSTEIFSGDAGLAANGGGSGTGFTCQANEITSGNNNTVVGLLSLMSNKTGSNNAAFGYAAGEYLAQTDVAVSGEGNTFIGAFSGPKAYDDGNYNVFIGHGAGTQGSNKLHISNSVTETPLIYGEFDPDGGLQGLVHIHGSLQSTNMRFPNKSVLTASSSGTAGEICWDSDYVYVCIATDTWKRFAISTW